MFIQLQIKKIKFILFSVILFYSNMDIAGNQGIKNEEIKDISCEEEYELIKNNKNNRNFVILDFRPEKMYLATDLQGKTSIFIKLD